MNDLLSEIAKHLSFKIKLVFKLSSNKLFAYVHIYKLNRFIYKKLNNKKMDLFPDLQEIIIGKQQLLNNLFNYDKLINLKSIEMQFESIQYSLNSTTLKKIFDVMKECKYLRKIRIILDYEDRSLDFQGLIDKCNLYYLDIVKCCYIFSISRYMEDYPGYIDPSNNKTLRILNGICLNDKKHWYYYPNCKCKMCISTGLIGSRNDFAYNFHFNTQCSSSNPSEISNTKNSNIYS